MNNIGLEWGTEFGTCKVTIPSIEWIMLNVKESMYNNNRCYVYNKAFARYFDNNDPYDGKTLAGALSPTGDRQNTIQEAVDCCSHVRCECAVFDDIRIWAEERGLYNAGDPKTQALKLVEEVGETCRAILKQDEPEIVDGIGDCVVVLTNLAHLCDTSIEECTRNAYNEIKNRKGRMNNGTFKKDD
jgi:NTP pyrophosphatase (non-canonical NTP hydrolase)